MSIPTWITLERVLLVLTLAFVSGERLQILRSTGEVTTAALIDMTNEVHRVVEANAQAHVAIIEDLTRTKVLVSDAAKERAVLTAILQRVEQQMAELLRESRKRNGS